MAGRKHGPGDWVLAGSAWLLLGCARLLLLRVPFKRIMPLAGFHLKATPADELELKPVSLDEPILGRIAWAVQAAAIRTPWESKCFAQALAGGMMLRWRSLPARIYFGVRPASANDDGKMTAHAWLASGHCIITGAQGFTQFTPVSCYGSQDRNQ